MKTVPGTLRGPELLRHIATVLLVGIVAFVISLALRPTIADAEQPTVRPIQALAGGGESSGPSEAVDPVTLKSWITDPVTGKDMWLSTGTVPLSPSFIEEALAKGQGEDVACPDGKECP